MIFLLISYFFLNWHIPKAQKACSLKFCYTRSPKCPKFAGFFCLCRVTFFEGLCYILLALSSIRMEFDGWNLGSGKSNCPPLPNQANGLQLYLWDATAGVQAQKLVVQIRYDTNQGFVFFACGCFVLCRPAQGFPTEPASRKVTTCRPQAVG